MWNSWDSAIFAVRVLRQGCSDWSSSLDNRPRWLSGYINHSLAKKSRQICPIIIIRSSSVIVLLTASVQMLPSNHTGFWRNDASHRASLLVLAQLML